MSRKYEKDGRKWLNLILIKIASEYQLPSRNFCSIMLFFENIFCERFFFILKNLQNELRLKHFSSMPVVLCLWIKRSSYKQNPAYPRNISLLPTLWPSFWALGRGWTSSAPYGLRISTESSATSDPSELHRT